MLHPRVGLKHMGQRKKARETPLIPPDKLKCLNVVLTGKIKSNKFMFIRNITTVKVEIFLDENSYQ